MSIDPICVIVNPGSGDNVGGDERSAQIARAMGEAGLQARVRLVTGGLKLPDAAREAASAGHEIVVAAGGDGTVAAVADALMKVEDRPQFGVLPLGTFNYFARAHNIPEEIGPAVSVIAGGHLRDVHTGVVNDRLFLNNTSIGLYPSILESREDVYSRWGRSRIAAYWSVALALCGMHKPMHLTITVDGDTQEIRTPLLFIANSAYQLENYNLEGADAIREGKFAIFASKGTRRRELAAAAWALARGKARKGQEFSLGTGRDIRIDMKRRKVQVAYDGERSYFRPPLTVKPTESPLRMLVPKDAA